MRVSSVLASIYAVAIVWLLARNIWLPRWQGRPQPGLTATHYAAFAVLAVGVSAANYMEDDWIGTSVWATIAAAYFCGSQKTAKAAQDVRGDAQ